MTIDHAARARALVGTRFRLQGRGAGGLDCVGVILSTFGIEPNLVRRDYRLQGVTQAEVQAGLLRHFRRVPFAQARSGDVLLLQVSEEQLHLAVRTADGFIHAHARIGRVVETPGPPEWPTLGVFRKRTRDRKAQ